MDTMGQHVADLGHGIGKIGNRLHIPQIAGDVRGGLNSLGQGIKNVFNYSPTPITSTPIGQQYQNHLKQVKDAENSIGSFKKGGEVKKTGNYKLHKGEFVMNPRLVALIKSGEGPKKKGYEQTYKTVPKKKYDWDKSLNYREKTGYFKTKINGGGHDAGYKWAKNQEISPKDRKRKYGANSPSFDEGVHEYKQNALKNIINKK